MSELDLERLLMAIAASDRTNAELAAEFNRAPSTIYNIKVKHRDRIDALRRRLSVQFEDLAMTRKQARLDDISRLRDLAWQQLLALLASNTVIDGRTGDVRSGSVDERKFKVFFELILKANRNFAEETGQLPQRVEGLGERFTLPVLGLSSSHGIDYAAVAQRRRDREAEAPAREAVEREREAERHTQMRQLLAAVGLDEQSSEHRVLSRERQSFEEWLVDEEQRLAQGQGPGDEWPDDPEAVEGLRADCDRLYPGDESMRARVERLIESQQAEERLGGGENVDLFRAIPPAQLESGLGTEPETDPNPKLSLKLSLNQNPNRNLN